jgi:pimeloyl-ACP methyl ester carboxylesterase
MTTMTIRDVHLFVDVIGTGPPLCLMHGGPGLDHTSLSSFRPCADQFTLIFYDHRCNGRSVGPPVSSMTWENLVADAEALRQALGFEKWAVLGHSFGGMVALELALRFPSAISHLLLLDTCGDARWAQQNAPEILAKRGYRAAAVRAARRFFTGQLAPREVMPTALKFFLAYYYRPNLLALAGDVLFGPRPVFQPEAHVFGFSQLYPGWSVMDRLAEIQIPTLVLSGRFDFLFPPEHQAALAAGIPNARLEIIENAGHNAHAERSAQVLPIVRRFLSTANQGGG